MFERLDEATGTMKSRQDAQVTAFSESLNVRKASGIQTFEHSMEQLARASVERWRVKFDAGLQALTKSLNEQFGAEDNDNHE
jgi:uncharacterized protein YbcV (DUF1398 family)